MSGVGDLLGAPMSPPQGPSSGIGDILFDLGSAKAQEATGLEWLKWQGIATAKTAGDAVMNIGTTAAKLLGGVEGAIGGEGFGAGWEAVAQDLEQTTGTRNPGVLEFAERVGQQVGIGDDRVDVGRQTDELIQKRLGNGAAIGRALGTVLSFATGPGAAVGRGGAALAKPVAQVGERMIANAVGRTLGVADEATSALLAQGKAWDWFAQQAAVQGLSGWRQAVLRTVGQNADDLLSTTAANIAQAYAMSPDDQRLAGVKAAAMMSPFMVPIARMGQSAERAIMEYGLTGASAGKIRDAVRSFESGSMGLSDFKRAVIGAVGQGRRFIAQGIVAPAIEGTAFVGLDPHAIDLAGKWWSGDAAAGAELGGMLLGTATGLAITKYRMPENLAPMWKAYRPDLNRLDGIWMEAEANKRAMEAEKPQEPQEPPPSIDGNEKLEFNAAEERRKKLVAEMMADRDGMLQAAQNGLRGDYGWAVEPTTPLLRGNWEPTFNADKSVTMTYGRDHVATIREGGALEVNAATEKVLRDYGLEGGPTFTGKDAEKALDNLALIGAMRRMSADRNFERRGFREVQPGVWADDGTGTYYQAQLDGTKATKSDPVGKWTGTDDIEVVGPSQTVWEHPAAMALTDAILVKHTTNPDPLVDGILAEAVEMAMTSNSAGAKALRAYFESTPPEAILNRIAKGEDRLLALDLASMASSTVRPEMVVPGTGGNRREPAGTGEPPLAADQEPSLAQRITAREALRPDQPAEAEAGSMAMLSPEARRAAGQAARKGWKLSSEYLFETQAEGITRNVPRETLGYEARRVASDAAELTSRSAEAMRPMEKLTRSQKRGVMRQSLPVEGYEADVATKPAWVDLFDMRREPATAAERTFQKGGQGYNAALRKAAVEAGTTRMQRTETGERRRVPLEEKGPAVQQRVTGQDSDAVYNNADLRKAWFEGLLKANPDDMTTVMGDDGKVTVRKTTVDDLNAEWKEQSNLPRGSDEAHEAAFEFTRRFKNMPYTWKHEGKVYEMLETDPFRTASTTIRKQAAQIAANRMWGQNVPADDRKAMLLQHEVDVKAGKPGLPKAVVENLQRGGAIERGKRFEKAVQDLPDTSRQRVLIQAGRNLISRAQGAEPQEALGWLGSRAWQNLQILSNAALSAAGGIRDIPDILFRLPSFAGLQRASKAIWAITLGGKADRGGLTRREYFEYAERVGAIQRQMGEWRVSEASTWATWAADVAGKPSNFLERLKGVIATHAADQWLAQIKKGRATTSDLELAQDMLRFSPADVLAMKDGKLTPAQETQWRREFVALVTSRTQPGEGSRFAASPTARATFRFINWITRRTGDNLRAVAAIKRTAKSDGFGSPANLRAWKRLIGLGVGSTLAGVLGNALVQTVTATVAGDPIDDGIKRVWNELSYAPFATAMKGLKSSVVGGPMTFAFEAAAEPGSAWAWTSLTAPTAYAYTLLNAAQAAAQGDPAGVTEWLSRLGFVPFRTQVRELLFTGMAGWVSDTQPRADAQLVKAWERLEGVEKPSGVRDKDISFYDALAEIREIGAKYPGEPKKAIAESADHLRKVLALAKEDSVAASIEARQLTKNLTLEQRSNLAEFVNDPQRMARIYQHDRVLRELASEVRKLEGAYPTPWEQDLQLVREQAAMGATDKWRPVLERALDETEQRVLNDEGVGDQLVELAEALSIYPEQIHGLFDARTSRFLLNDEIDTETKARRIARVLRERVLDRAKASRRKKAREENAGG